VPSPALPREKGTAMVSSAARPVLESRRHELESLVYDRLRRSTAAHYRDADEALLRQRVASLLEAFLVALGEQPFHFGQYFHRIAEERFDEGFDLTEKQHEAGKLTARERLARLFEPDTFQETNLFLRHRSVDFGMAGKELPGEGVVTGYGVVDGRPVYAASQDFTVAGGSVGEAGARKICEAMDAALKTGDPFIFINDSGGARIQEGVDALAGYGGIFHRNVLLSGVVPQVSPSPAPAPAAPRTRRRSPTSSSRSAGRPAVHHRAEGDQGGHGQEITAEALGGAESHARLLGRRTLRGGRRGGDRDRQAAALLPARATTPMDPPFLPELHATAVESDEGLNAIVPEDSREAYDMRDVIRRIVDRGDFLEIQADYAANILIGLGRIGGRTVGIVANQPQVKAGVLDIDSSTRPRGSSASATRSTSRS
jgi:methylmalonyl-CoA carboxyltransferase 12S subunit